MLSIVEAHKKDVADKLKGTKRKHHDTMETVRT
jgi:hypothetical protein